MDTEKHNYTDIEFDVTSPARELAKLRDQLILKVHLAKADLRSEWEELEKKWTLLQSRLKVLEVAGKGAAQDVRAAAQQLLQELKVGFERMRDALERM